MKTRGVQGFEKNAKVQKKSSRKRKREMKGGGVDGKGTGSMKEVEIS